MLSEQESIAKKRDSKKDEAKSKRKPKFEVSEEVEVFSTMDQELGWCVGVVKHVDPVSHEVTMRYEDGTFSTHPWIAEGIQKRSSIELCRIGDAVVVTYKDEELDGIVDVVSKDKVTVFFPTQDTFDELSHDAENMRHCMECRGKGKSKESNAAGKLQNAKTAREDESEFTGEQLECSSLGKVLTKLLPYRRFKRSWKASHVARNGKMPKNAKKLLKGTGLSRKTKSANDSGRTLLLKEMEKLQVGL